MHSPSTWLLRALRSSLSIASYRTSEPASPFAQLVPHTHVARCSCLPRNLSTITPKHGYYRKPSSSSRPSKQSSQPPYPCQQAFFLGTSYLKPKSRCRSLPPEEQDAATTDLGALDVLAGVAAPTTAIDACVNDGFHLNNGFKITGGDGCLLIDGESFAWRPWEGDGKGMQGMINGKGQWEVAEEAWGLLKLLWPKPGAFLRSHYVPFASHLFHFCFLC